MNKNSIQLRLLLIVIVLVAALRDARAATTAELLGKWAGGNFSYTFQPDGKARFTAEAGTMTIGGTYTYTVDFTKTPATIDLVEMGGEKKGIVSRGVFELKGNSLKIGFNEEKQMSVRPESMAAAKVVMDLKRVEEEKDDDEK